MYLSKHNIEFKIDDTLYLLNPLSGAFSKFESMQIKREWNKLKNGDTPSKEFVEYLKSKSFLFSSKEEEDNLTTKLRKLSSNYFNRKLRCNIVLTYDCNLSCIYCFEKGIERKNIVMSIENAERCLNILKNVSKEYETVEIVLIGGEPLLYNVNHLECVKYILNYSLNECWDVDIVTNGVDLEKYVPLLKGYKNISQIQITIDGPKKLHDLRKPKEDGTGSFEDIVKSIDVALANDLPIVCRINVDKDNVSYLPSMIQLFDQKKWFEYKFGAYAGLTFDFFGDYEYQGQPHEILEQILKMRIEDPIMKKLSLEAWEPIQFILHPYFTGKPRLPKFAYCCAQRSEISMDLNGKIYFCADSVGRAEYEMGYYNNEIFLNSEAAHKLRNFDVTKAENVCKDCNLQLCCGGGCWFRREMLNKKPSNSCITTQKSLINYDVSI